jgi:hypothetical protein
MNINGVNILYEIKTDVFCRPEMILEIYLWNINVVK